VNTAREGVIDRTLDGNRFAARAEAEQMALETEHRWRALEFEARDPRLRAMLAAGPGSADELDAWLAERREKYNHDFRKDAQASLWTALDRGGYMRGMSPSFPQYRGKYFGFRDYFTGLGRNVPDEQGPPKQIIDGPYRSLVYRRRSTQTWAVTFSVPVPPAKTGDPAVGVLTMSIELKSEGAADPARMKRFSVLVDTRPDANGKPGLVVRHPYLAALPEDTDDTKLPLYYAGQLLESRRDRSDDWQRLPRYEDPVKRAPFDGGTWLAVAEPVVVRAGHEKPVDTGFVIVVQERRDDVLQPVYDLQWRLGYGAAVAGAFLLVVVVVVWFGTVSVLGGAPKSRVTRFLRRMAGLPTSTTGTATTGTLGLGTAGTGGASVPVPGGKTARLGAAATPGAATPAATSGQESGRFGPTPTPTPPPADPPAANDTPRD
jgi:hypothetical protein